MNKMNETLTAISTVLLFVFCGMVTYEIISIITCEDKGEFYTMFGDKYTCIRSSK